MSVDPDAIFGLSSKYKVVSFDGGCALFGDLWALMAAIVIYFWVLNQCLSIVNAWAIGSKGFRAPCFIASVQAGVSWAVVVLAAACGSERMRRAVQSRDVHVGSPGAWSISSVALWSTLNVVLNNASLMYISLSLNQIIRSSIPVVTAVVSSAHGSAPSKGQAGALGLLTAGVLLVIAQSRPEAHGTELELELLIGVMLCLGGTIAGAYMLHSTNKVLRSRSSFNAIDLGFRVAPMTVVMLLGTSYDRCARSVLVDVRRAH